MTDDAIAEFLSNPDRIIEAATLMKQGGEKSLQHRSAFGIAATGGV